MFNFSKFQSQIYEPLPVTFLMRWNALCAARTEIILCMGSANERRRYIVTPPPIGWAQNNPWVGPEWMNLWCAAKSPHREHYSGVIMSAMTSQITGNTIVCSTVCSGADQRKHQSSAPLALVRRIHRWPVNSPHKGPVTRKIFPFDDVIMRVFILSGWWCFVGCARKVHGMSCLIVVNTLKPRQNGRHFAGDVFKCISLNENV